MNCTSMRGTETIFTPWRSAFSALRSETGWLAYLAVCETGPAMSGDRAKLVVDEPAVAMTLDDGFVPASSVSSLPGSA